MSEQANRHAVAIVDLPDSCDDCRFNAYQSDGTQYCMMQYTRARRSDSRPPRCQLIPWQSEEPRSGTDWVERAAGRLRALRSARRLSQEQAGEESGYSQAAIAQAESGERSNLTFLCDLCDYYGVSPAELFRDLGGEKDD